MIKRGRKPKPPSADDRAKVVDLLKEDTPITHIAKMLGLSAPTFRKYFQSEILASKKAAEPVKQRKITEDMRTKVKRYIGCKMPLRKVALAMGYETDAEIEQFKADFAREIEIGDAVYRAKVLDKLDAQMEGGVLGATTKLEALTQIIEPGEPSQAQSPGYVGKKAAAKAEAAAVAASGGKFAPRTPPRLAVVGGKTVSDKSA